MSFETWQQENLTPTTGFETWQAENVQLEAPQNLQEDVGGLEAFSTEFGRSILRAFMRVGSGFVGTAEYLIPGEQEFLTKAKENIDISAEQFDPKYEGYAAKAGQILGQALPYMGAALVAGYAAAGAAGAAGASLAVKGVAALTGAATVSFSVEGQGAFDDAIETGATEDEANNERLIVGSINAVIEAAQIGRLMKFHKAGGASLKSFIRNVRNRVWDAAGKNIKNFTGTILRTAIEEGLEEAAQEGVSIAAPLLLRGEGPKKEDGSIDWGAVIDRVGVAGISGAFAGGVLGGAGALVSASSELGRPSDSSIDDSISKVNKMKISDKEKELWIGRLEEHRIEVRDDDLQDTLKGVDIPENTVAIYQGKESGNTVYETKGGDEVNTEEDGRIVSTETGEELELNVELSQPDTIALLKKDLPALKREWDNDLTSAVKEMDISLRKEHKEQIKTEKGKRVSVAKDIMTDTSIPAQTRFAMAKKYLAGELGLRFDPLQFNEDQISYFYQRVLISNADFFTKLNAEAGLNSLFGLYKDSKGRAKLPEPGQIKALEEVWGVELSEALFDLRGENNQLSHKILETMNFPRALLASFDFSAGGRQGLMLLPIAPKQWLKAVYQGYRAWTSPEYTDFVNIQMQTDPYYRSFKDAGGYLTDVGSMERGEEVFMSRYAKKIPGIKASEQAYTTTLNSLRFYTYKKFAQKWRGTGKSKEDYRMLAEFINHATGRGDLKGLKKFAPFLNAAFFAPRLQMGRVQVITDLFKGIGTDIKTKQFNPVRKIIAADLMSFFGGGMGILWLLSLMKGVTVEKDPRSSDFGKIRFGNTRIDFWSGYNQMARLVAQMVTGKRKSTTTGDISEAERGNVLWRFLQSKMSPAAGITVDLMRGEDFLGEPLEITGASVTAQVYQRFTPLFFQDVIDAAHYQGLMGAGIVAPLALHGIGAMTYAPTPSSEVSRLRDVTSMEVFGKAWDELSGESQGLLKEARPEIVIAEKKAKIAKKNYGMIAASLKEQRRVTDRIIKALPKDVRKQIKDLDVYIPGLSRRIAGNWYLSDKKYSEYQQEVQSSLSIFLPRLIALPIWGSLDSEMRATLIEEVASEVRKEVSRELLRSATMDDLEQLEGR